MCRIAWAEAYAALSRRAREMPEDAFVIEQAKMAFAADWSHFVVLALTNHWLSVRVRIPDQSCHLFQPNAATHSISKLPPIPVNAATH